MIAAIAVLTALGVPAWSQSGVTYRTPPKCQVWIEGESCRNHNWIEGPTSECWAFGWAGVHGGVLDLASWRLPERGDYYAQYRFDLPETGEHRLYFLGRVPGLLASPIEWCIDSGELHKVGGGYDVPGLLVKTETWKYCVLDLGTFEAQAGRHWLTIYVREPADDMGLMMYTQQIDALAIAPASWPVEGEARPTRQAAARQSPGGGHAFAASGMHLDQLLAPDCVSVEYVDGQVRVCDAGDCAIRAISGDDGALRIEATVTNTRRAPIQRVTVRALTGASTGDTWRVAQETYSAEQALGGLTRRSPQLAWDWVCVTGPHGAVYAMVEDAELIDTEVAFGGPSGEIAFSKYPCIPPGETWRMPTVVVGATEGGDWHDAADRYATWWRSTDPRVPQTPEWAQRIGGMALGGEVHAENAVADNRDMLAHVQAASGISWFHGSDWIDRMTECWYPVQYDQSPERLDQMRRATDDLRDAGCRSSIYSNPVMFSRACREYEEWGRDLACVTRDGAIRLTEHTHHHHPMALPQPSREWGERFAECVEGAVVTGRPDMLYLDQLGAVPSYLDFAHERHGHEHYGSWVKGSVEFVEAVRQRFARERPDLVTAIETIHPAIQQYADFGLMGTSRAFRYTFPDLYGFVGPYAGVDGPTAVELARESLLTGQPLLLLDGGMGDATDAERRVVREIIELKRLVDPELRRAAFRDTSGVVASEGSEATLFLGDGCALVAFARTTGETTTLTVDGAWTEADLSAAGAPAAATCAVDAGDGTSRVGPMDAAAGVVTLR